MSVFLEMVKGWHQGGIYNYKITMKNIAGRREDLVKEYTSDFEDGLCWGYNRFYRLEDLEEHGYWDSENDSIKLTVEISSSTLMQEAKD